MPRVTYLYSHLKIIYKTYKSFLKTLGAYAFGENKEICKEECGLDVTKICCLHILDSWRINKSGRSTKKLSRLCGVYLLKSVPERWFQLLETTYGSICWGQSKHPCLSVCFTGYLLTPPCHHSISYRISY